MPNNDKNMKITTWRLIFKCQFEQKFGIAQVLMLRYVCQPDANTHVVRSFFVAANFKYDK